MMSRSETVISKEPPLTILMVAGEVSGDLQGAFLARALRAQAPELQMIGAGGQQMRSAGVDLRVETTHFSSIGLLEPLRYLRPLQQAFRKIRKLIQAERPQVAILIDNHGFNHALARFLRGLGIPVIYYFPPQVWVGSFLFAASIARASGLIISAFAREAEIYRQHGGRAVYLGHPLVDIVKPKEDANPVLAKLGLDAAQPLMAVMPGSRTQEVNQLAGPMLGAARIIQSRHPGMRFLLPLASPHLRPFLQKELERAGMTRHFHIICDDFYTSLSRCSVVLTTSGTSTLEAALLGVPMVVTYRIDALSCWLARKLAITSYIAMPNILLNEPVVPELTQGDATPERLAAAALELLENPPRAAAMRARLGEVCALLGTKGVIERVASRILQEMEAKSGAALSGVVN
jgi:lipid-A-disaccharide synthase